MKQRYTNLEIAKVALCSEATVKKAVERGLKDDLESVLGWVLLQRVKSLGISGIDLMAEKPKSVFPNMVTAESLGIVKKEEPKESVIDKLGYEPDNSQMEGKW